MITLELTRITARRLLLPAALMLGLAGCATGPDVSVSVDNTADFTAYRSFGFVSPLGTDRAGYQSVVSQHLKAAVTRELVARGLVPTESSPQLLINFSGRLSEKLRVETMPAPPVVTTGFGWGYYGYRTDMYSTWPTYAQGQRVSTYTEGTLNIDVVDAMRKQMVWEGVVIGQVGPRTTENLQASVDTAVAAAFAKFPLPAPKPKP
jgi:hypothetical protein